MSEKSWSDRYIKLVEAWILAMGICAFGSIAYNTPMVRPGLMDSWKPITYLCLIIAFTVIYAAVDPLIDAVSNATSKAKKWVHGISIVACIVIFSPSAWASFILTEQWVANKFSIDWCIAHAEHQSAGCQLARKSR